MNNNKKISWLREGALIFNANSELTTLKLHQGLKAGFTKGLHWKICWYGIGFEQAMSGNAGNISKFYLAVLHESSNDLYI